MEQAAPVDSRGMNLDALVPSFHAQDYLVLLCKAVHEVKLP